VADARAVAVVVSLGKRRNELMVLRAAGHRRILNTAAAG